MAQLKKGLAEEVDTMNRLSFGEKVIIALSAIVLDVLCTMFGTHGYWWWVMR